MMRAALIAAAALAVVAMPANAALVVTQDDNVAAARTAFGGVITHDWDLGGAPGSVAAAPGSTIDLQNYIDGDGFDGIDLAIGGVENFVLNFAAPVKRVGFAAATGTGVYPGEVNQNGAVFAVLTNTGETGTLTLAPGSGFTTWVVVQSATAFSSLRFIESGDLFDQYFGDVASAAVPEPAAWAMMVGGFGLLGAVSRRRRSATVYA